MIVDLSHLHEIAFALLWALGRASAIAVISFLVAWIICRAIPKLPPAIKCWIWRLAFVRVLISLFPAAVVALPLLRSEPTPRIQMVADTFINDGSASSAKPAPTPPFIKSTVDGEVKVSRLPFVAFSVWLGGVVSGCVLLAIRWSRTSRLRQRCLVVTDASALKVFHRIVQDVGVRRPPPLHQSDEVDSPLLLGVIRPRIVIPRSMLTADAASLWMMLAHELTHFRRHDTRWAMLPMLTRLLFWFHPLVVLAERELDAWREIACDDAAIAAGDASIPDYARMLINVAAASSRRIPLMAIGVIRSRSTLRRRLLAMQTFNSWSGRRRTIIAAAIAALGVCGVIPWTLAARSTSAVAGQAGSTTQADSGPLSKANSEPADEGIKASFPGYVLTDDVTMRAAADGTIAKVDCKLGDRVARGQQLIGFDSSSASAAVSRAQAALKKDQTKYDRWRHSPKGTVSEGEVSELQLNVESDRADLESSLRVLASEQTIAPLRGVIATLKVHEGEFVTKGEPLVTVVSVTDLKATADIPADMYPKIRIGKRVTFETSIYPQEFSGKIDFISPMVETRSNTIRVRASIDDPDERLHPGLQGILTIRVE